MAFRFAAKLYKKLKRLDEIRMEFRKFEGGRVTVQRNDADGLAMICLDHPEKKNGLSGKMHSNSTVVFTCAVVLN